MSFYLLSHSLQSQACLLSNCFVPFFSSYRLTILPPEEKIAPMYERLSKFHKEFMDKYKDDKEN